MVDSKEIERSQSRQTAAIVVLVCALHFLRFGYDFGVSDQDEFVPAVLHAIDESVLASDWFVASQAADFNVRTPTVVVLATLTPVFGVAGAVLLLYVVSLVVLIVGVIRLVRLLTTDALAPILATVLLLVLTPRFTLGGNDLTHGLFVPSMMAWALCIHGFVAAFRRSPVIAGFVFGLATWMQPLVGILTAFTVCFGLFVASLGRGSRRTADTVGPMGPGPVGPGSVGPGPVGTAGTAGTAIREAALCGITLIAVSLPFLLVIARGHLTDSSAASGDLFNILVHVRAPHHYLPSSFSPRSFVRFGVLAAAGLTSISLAKVLLPYRRGLLGILATIAGLCVIYVIGVEAVGSLAMAKLQLFKMTVVVKVFAGVAVSVSIAEALRDSHAGVLVARLLESRAAPLLSIGFAASVAVAAYAGTLDDRVGILKRNGSVQAELSQWARIDTPSDAIFAVPPSNSDFRTWSRRAIVINFKAFAFQDDLMLEWQRRLVDMTGNTTLRSAFVPSGELDEDFERLSAENLTLLSDKYGFTYVLRSTRLVEADKQFPAWTEAADFGRDAPNSVRFFVYRRAPHETPTR